MANARLWLVYKPTGKKFPIAKRFGTGYYTGREDSEFNNFLEEAACWALENDYDKLDDFDLEVG